MGASPSRDRLRAVVPILALLTGCNAIAGLGDFDDIEETGPASAASGTAIGPSSGAATTTATGSSSGGGAGGAGGSGAGGSGGGPSCDDVTCEGAAYCDAGVCRGALLFALPAGDIEDRENNQSFEALAFDDEDLIVAGAFRGSLDLEPGFLSDDFISGDSVLARIAPSGDVLLAEDYDVAGEQPPHAIVPTRDGGIGLAGQYTGRLAFDAATGPDSGIVTRAYFAHLTSDFVGTAATTMGGTEFGESAQWSRARAEDGIVLGTGTFDAATTLEGCDELVPAGDEDVFFAEVDDVTGECLRAASIGSAEKDYAAAYLADGDRRYLVVGCGGGADGCNFGDTTLTPFPVPCVVQSGPDLDPAMTSFTCMSDENFAYAVDGELGPEGSVIVVGAVVRSFRAAPFVARLQPGSSDPLWVTVVGNGDGDDPDDVAVRVAAHADGRLRVLIVFSGTITIPGRGELRSNGLHDSAVLEVDPTTGAVLSVRQLGGDGEDIFADLAIGPDGRVCVAGTFSESIDLGTGAIPAHSGLDALVACFAD